MKLRESRLKEFDSWSCRHFRAYLWTCEVFSPSLIPHSLLNFPYARLSLKLKFYYLINKFNGIVLINKKRGKTGHQDMLGSTGLDMQAWKGGSDKSINENEDARKFQEKLSCSHYHDTQHYASNHLNRPPSYFTHFSSSPLYLNSNLIAKEK